MRRFALLAVFLAALALRIVRLDDVPPGLDTDEASIGYNAYSLLHTGRDEHGESFPLLFQAFGEYKRPVAIYAAVPSVAVFGATPAAVRLPTAVAGALSVVAMYALARLTLRDRRAALVAATLLAISPWHLQLTRSAKEAAWFLLGLMALAALLVGAFRSRGHHAGLLLLGAGALFLVAIYSYYAGPIVAPLLVAAVTLAYWPRWRRVPRAWVWAAVAIVLMGTAPLLSQFADGSATSRMRQVSVFTSSEVTELAAQRAAAGGGAPMLLDHPYAIGARLAIHSYLSHFDPRYLFTHGDAEPRHRSSDTAQLYLWDAPLLLVGLWRVAHLWGRPAFALAGSWLLIGPLPAAFAENAPHAIRSFAMVPAWYLIAAAGVVPMWRWLRQRNFHRDWVLVLALSVAYYLSDYHRHYPAESGSAWSSGTAEAMRAAQQAVESGRYNRVVVHLDSGFSYSQVLYAVGYDPRRYLEQGGTPAGSRNTQSFAPFELRSVDFASEPRAPNVLYVVGAGTGLPTGARIVQTVRDAGGRDAVMLVSL